MPRQVWHRPGFWSLGRNLAARSRERGADFYFHGNARAGGRLTAGAGRMTRCSTDGVIAGSR